MKKYIFLCVFISFILLLFGCSKKTEDVTISHNSFIEVNSHAGHRYVYVNNNMLYLQDMETNQSMILCSKTNCEHKPYDEVLNPDPECEAATRPGCTSYASIGIYNDCIYAFETNNNQDELELYKMELGAQGWFKIGKIPYGIYGEADSYYVNDYAYIDGFKTEYPSEASTEFMETTVLLKIDLKTGKYEELGTKYSSKYYCRMRKLDYSDGILCYENQRLKEGYTNEDLDIASDISWEGMFDTTVCTIACDSGKEEKMDFRMFTMGEYIAFKDSMIYYRNGGLICRWDIRSRSESGIGEMEENESAQSYLPYGIELYNSSDGKSSRIYDIAKKRWYDLKSKGKNYDVLSCSEDYVRVMTYDKETAEVQSEDWVTWKNYINGIHTAKEADALNDELVKNQSVSSDAVNREDSASPLEDPELDSAFYETHWKGKTVITWWNYVNIPSHIIVALNDKLVELGKDYVVKMKYVANYTDEYFDSLKSAKREAKALDVYCTPSQFEGKKLENKYEKCKKTDLMEPLDQYLASEEGTELYHAFFKKQWDGMRIDGKIYSYDWRGMPVQDVCAFVNQKYIDKYELQIDQKTSLKELFQMAKMVSEKEDNEQLIPIFYAIGEKESSLTSNPIKGLDKLREKYPGLFYFWGAGEGKDNFDFFLEIANEDFITTSSDKVVVRIPAEHIVKCKKVVLKTGKYEPVTNSLTAVASWSKHKQEAFDFISEVNVNKDIATLLSYGVEGSDYVLEQGYVKMKNDAALNYSSIGNKWITPPYQLEPEDKENVYRKYIGKRLE